MVLVIILGMAAALFVLSFVTRRRFGVLGLGLAAGLVLAQLWSVTVSAVFQAQGIKVDPLSYSTVGQVLVTLLPAVVLLIAGPRYHSKKGAFVGSLLFALFGTLLVFLPITRDFAVAGDSNQLVDGILVWHSILVALGIMLAIGDTLLTTKPKNPHHKDKH